MDGLEKPQEIHLLSFSLSDVEFVFMDFLIFAICCPYARFPGLGQNLVLFLKSPVKAWEFCPLVCSEVSSSHGNSFGEAWCFQWSLMLHLNPAEEKTLNRELLLTFSSTSAALFSRQ